MSEHEDKSLTIMAQLLTEIQELNATVQALASMMMRPTEKRVDYYGEES